MIKRKGYNYGTWKAGSKDQYDTWKAGRITVALKGRKEGSLWHLERQEGRITMAQEGRKDHYDTRKAGTLWHIGRQKSPH